MRRIGYACLIGVAACVVPVSESPPQDETVDDEAAACSVGEVREVVPLTMSRKALEHESLRLPSGLPPGGGHEQCKFMPSICEDRNECTIDSCTNDGCKREVAPLGSPCSVGQCDNGVCLVFLNGGYR